MEEMCPRIKEDHKYIANKPYREALGLLMWAQVATCSDLLFAIGLLICFQSNSSPSHWTALLHVLGYVKGTLKYKLTYSRQQDKDIKPVGFVNADYGGDVDSRKLTSEYVFIMAGDAVS